jgi:Peroxidase
LSRPTKIDIVVADLIALSLAVVTDTCSIPRLKLPLRVGRVDAAGPGPTGVPQPETDLQDTLSSFENAGFSQSETIVRPLCSRLVMGNLTSFVGFDRLHTYDRNRTLQRER